MKKDGTMHPTDQVPVAPDTVATVIGSSVGAVAGFDWPAGAGIVTFAVSSGGVYVNMFGNAAAHIPTTASSGNTGSSERNEFVPSSMTRQISGDSTGWSIAFPTSGIIVTVSIWGK